MPTNVRPEHLDRIKAFLVARVEPLYGAGADDTARALRALRIQIEHLAANTTLIPLHEERGAVDQRFAEIRVEFAWTLLCEMARFWKDHPDYLHEFTLQPWELTPARKES